MDVLSTLKTKKEEVGEEEEKKKRLCVTQIVY